MLEPATYVLELGANSVAHKDLWIRMSDALEAFALVNRLLPNDLFSRDISAGIVLLFPASGQKGRSSPVILASAQKSAGHKAGEKYYLFASRNVADAATVFFPY